MKTNKEIALLILDILEERVDKLGIRHNDLYKEMMLTGSKISEVKDGNITENKIKLLQELNEKLIDIENEQEEIHKELEDNLNKLRRIGARLTGL
jgi:hypothetical protein